MIDYISQIHSNSHGCEVGNKTEFIISAKLTEEEFQENPIINWDAILWVNRPTVLWVLQLLLAMVSLTQSLVLTYLGYKVSRPTNPWFHRDSNYFLLISGQHLATDTLISLYTRISNDNTLCTYGRFLKRSLKRIYQVVNHFRLFILRCGICSFPFSSTAGWPSDRWRICL